MRVHSHEDPNADCTIQLDLFIWVEGEIFFRYIEIRVLSIDEIILCIFISTNPIKITNQESNKANRFIVKTAFKDCISIYF